MPKIRYAQSTGSLGIASNGTTAATVATFGASLLMPDGAAGNGGILDLARIDNQDTVSHRVELHLVPSGGAVGANTRCENITLAPGEVYRHIGGERMPSGATVQVKLGEAHTTNPVYVKCDMSEIH